MELIDKYIHEVTRRLSQKDRAAIALELKAIIEEMLPSGFTEEDVKEALVKLGDPAVLAKTYLEKPMYLIGPLYYQSYISLLKTIVPIAMTIALIAFVIEFAFSYEGDEALLMVVLTLVGNGIGMLLEVAIQVFFWLTLIFALLERFAKEPKKELLTGLEKWTLNDLKKVQLTTKHKSISKYAFFGSLVWTAIWVSIYFNADRLIGVYLKREDDLIFKYPTFNQQILNDFWILIVIIAVLGIALSLFKRIQGQWTKKVVVFQTFYELIATAAFIIIITRPNIIEPEFTKYLLNFIDMQEDRFVLLIVLATIVIAVITSAFSIKDAVSRSRM
ncbi:HAAS signaling domain-containing protein [Viridibacillus sp. NPDC093762]|uniref:HAAS signaling domain-containing protein n=1 Tax=Viridibacillus sp. NPDC093762 TaxID=3390720 RepID=UPI003CFF5F45